MSYLFFILVSLPVLIMGESDVMERVQELGGGYLGRVEDRCIFVVDSDVLGSLGHEFTLIDTFIPPYSLVRGKRKDALWRGEVYAIVRGRELGGMPLRLYSTFPRKQAKLVPNLGWLNSPPPILDSIAGAVSEDTIFHLIKVLSGVLPYPSGYRDTTRYVLFPGCDTASYYLGDILASYAPDTMFYHSVVETVVWSSGKTLYVDSRNVVSIRRGRYSEEGVVVGGHFDAISPYRDYAPGANDNATAVAVVLECARIFNDLPVDRDIYFVGFTAEELGFIGSEHIVEEFFLPESIDLLVMVNNEMLGYFESNWLGRLGIGEFGYSSFLAQIAFKVLQHYGGIDLLLGATTANSDHYSFEVEGYPVLCFWGYDPDPYYHTPYDKVWHLHPGYLTSFVRGIVPFVYALVSMPDIVQDLRITEVSDDKIEIVWNKGEDDVVGYRVFFDTVSMGRNIFSEDTVCTLAVVSRNAEHFISVSAVDSLGFESFACCETVFIPVNSVPRYRGKRLCSVRLSGNMGRVVSLYGNGVVEVVDVMGRVIWKGEVSGRTEIGGLSSGIYFVRDSRGIFLGKVVVMR